MYSALTSARVARTQITQQPVFFEAFWVDSFLERNNNITSVTHILCSLFCIENPKTSRVVHACVRACVRVCVCVCVCVCHRLNCDYSLGGVMGSVLMCIFSVD